MIRRGLVGLGLAVASILVVVLLAEGALRLTPFRNLLSFSRSHVPQYYYRADPLAGYDIAENFPKSEISLGDGVSYPIWSNSIGCFDTPYKGEKDFVLLLGDSFTHAFAPFDDKWGSRMESLLGMRVLKCGVSGYGTKQEVLKAERICSLTGQAPRLIVVGYSMNDLMDDYLFPQYGVTEGYFYIAKRLADQKTGRIVSRVRTGPPRSPKIWLKQHSITYNLLERALGRLEPSGEQVIRTEAPEGQCEDPSHCPAPWLSRAWGNHISQISRMAEVARSKGATLLFVLIPVRSQVYPFLISETDPFLAKKYAIVKEEIGKTGAACLDLLPLLRMYARKGPPNALDARKDLYWPVDGHLNIRGNHLAGLLVSRYILENNLLSVPARDSRLDTIRQELTGFGKPEKEVKDVVTR